MGSTADAVDWIGSIGSIGGGRTNDGMNEGRTMDEGVKRLTGERAR